MARSRDLGRHLVAFPGVRLIITGLNHPRHQPIHNEVQPHNRFLRPQQYPSFHLSCFFRICELSRFQNVPLPRSLTNVHQLETHAMSLHGVNLCQQRTERVQDPLSSALLHTQRKREEREMGCSFSGLNALYDSVNGGGDVWINENRFRIVRQLGEGGFAYVYLVKEVVNVSSPASSGGRAAVGGGLSKKVKDKSHLSVDGTYAMKKVLIQNNEQLELVREEIRVSSLFNHSNLLPLLDHAIISVKATQEGSWNHEAYLLFPVHLDGTLLDNSAAMKSKKEFFSTTDVLQIFRQLCAGLKNMHNLDPPYAHNDVKPGNVLLTHRKGQSPLAILMDFGSARPARKQIRSRSEALQLQEWASEHCSAPFRAPELWDCPSHADIDERTDIWSLGCTLYAIMYGVSPFEYALGESGGSLQLAIVNAQIKWPAGPKPPYPEALHQFVTWMLQPQAAVRPHIDDIIIHVDKLISKFSN